MARTTAVVQTTAVDVQMTGQPRTATEVAQSARLVKDYFAQATCPGTSRSRRSAGSSPVTPEGPSTLPSQSIDADPLPVDLSERLTSYEPYIASFRPLQEWEGYVIEIAQDHFTARLVDITAGTHVEEEEVDLPLSDLTLDERSALKLGSALRWVIGYEIKWTGQRRKASQIVFRQLPRWTKQELAEAQKEGQQRAARIKWE